MFRKAVLALSMPLVFCASAFAMKPKSYQVSGPVVSFTATTVTIQKTTGEQLTIARDVITKTNAPLKVGDLVTVMYTMAADEIDVKPGTVGNIRLPAKMNSNTDDAGQSFR